MKIAMTLCALALAGCSLAANVGQPKPAAPAPTAEPERGAHAAPSGLITIPDIVWKSEADARASLAAAGHTGTVSISDALCPPEMDGRIIELGTICYQHPPAGRRQGARLPIQIKIQTRHD